MGHLFLIDAILNAGINDTLARDQTTRRMERIDARGARRDYLRLVATIDRPLLR
jgi:hypothetical protein